MEVTKWLKPSISVSQIGDSASVRRATIMGPASENLHRSGHSISSSAQGARAHSGTAVSPSDSMFQSVPPNGGFVDVRQMPLPIADNRAREPNR
jgi:hypothetical protein